MAPAVRLAAAALAAAALAGCGSGDGSDRAVADLRSRVEAQSSEVDALRKELADMHARARLLEERAAAREVPSSPAAPAPGAAPAGKPAGEDASPEPAARPEEPGLEATDAYFESEVGRRRIEEAIEAVERRRQEQATAQRKERVRAMIEERVKGTLTERLGLDAQQQQSVIRVTAEAYERMEELFAGMRDGRGDPTAFAQAREKGQQIRQDAMGQLQQALTVDQYNKLQETMAEDRGGGLLGFPGGRGGFGLGGGGPTNAPGGAR